MEKYKIVEENMGIIGRLAQSYYRRVASFGIDYDDLLQEGAATVCHYLDRYDPDKASITTFVYNYAGYGMSKYINKNISLLHIPGNVKKHSYQLMQEYFRFFKENNRNMTDEEMLDYLEKNIPSGTYVFDINYVKTLLFVYFNCLSDKMVNYDDIGEAIDDKCFEDEVLGNMVTENVVKFIRKVNPKTSETYIKYYGLEDGDRYNTVELADSLDVTPQAISYRILQLNKKLAERKDTLDRIIKE